MKENQAKMIKFDFVNMKWEGLTIEQIQLWEHLYRHVDVLTVLKVDMVRWLDKKVLCRAPLKVAAKARKKNWKATIVNWLSREEMKGVGL